MPVAILIHSGAPHDTKIFTEYKENLRKRRIISKKDTIIFGRRYYKYEKYQIGISKYKIVPLIFPKEKFKLQKLKDKLTYPYAYSKIKRHKNKPKNYTKH